MMKRLVSMGVLAVGSLIWTLHASAECKRPRTLIVLDKSSSMITGTVANKTKWDVAKDALNQVLSTYQGTVDFGLMVFPNPNQCGPGNIRVPVAPSNAAAISSELTTPPPTGGNYTPMAQSLDVAGTTAALNDSAYASHILLITDGWQWCDPYDASTRFLPVNSVTNLSALNIKTWVVGFGESVDALTLNKMADAAKTKISATCNVAGSDATAANNCYYQANDPAQLVAALQNIASQISTELCDGQDNNCNGLIDEGVTGPTCVKQQGVCAGALKRCGGVQGWSSCAASDYDQHAAKSGAKYESSESICDGKDNDCDGTIDEGCSCQNGQTRPCGGNKGACTQGTQTCTNGAWAPCLGEVQASTEVCDNRDNNCDGTVDEALSRACSTACGTGTESCQTGQWKGCTAPQPSAEICDGMDNDCDGVTDGPSATCTNGGTCVGGTCQPVGTNGGCDCDLGHQDRSTPLPLLALSLLGLLLLVRTRRPR